MILRFICKKETRQLKSIIDYMIIRQISTIKVMDFRVFRDAEWGSDHFLLRAKCAWQWTQNKATSTRGRGGAHEVDSVNLEDLPINIESF